jgi:hypothetical protein
MWSLRPRTLPVSFIPPCLPTAASRAPSGDQWWHEIKHDGIRVIARKEEKRVKLYSRLGNDLTGRFPLIIEALARRRKLGFFRIFAHRDGYASRPTAVMVVRRVPRLEMVALI